MPNKKLNHISPETLQWPEGWDRNENPKRSQFYSNKNTGYGRRNKSCKEATDFLLEELRRLGVKDDQDVIITNNMRTRNDGLPYSNAKEPDDSGVAVYFMQDGQERCFPCDTYDRVADNIYAIGKVIESLRAIDRHSTQMMNASFSGFKALPGANETSGEAWWITLDVSHNASFEEVKKAYKEKAKKHHPDKNPNDPQASVKFRKIREAYDQARAALNT